MTLLYAPFVPNTNLQSVDSIEWNHDANQLLVGYCLEGKARIIKYGIIVRMNIHSFDPNDMNHYTIQILNADLGISLFYCMNSTRIQL